MWNLCWGRQTLRGDGATVLVCLVCDPVGLSPCPSPAGSCHPSVGQPVGVLTAAMVGAEHSGAGGGAETAAFLWQLPESWHLIPCLNCSAHSLPCARHGSRRFVGF